jgi:divalent metal cation (Fe/Co/Zn/Cd) transporter
MQMSPDDILVNLSISFAPALSSLEVAQAIARIEQRIRAEFGAVKHIFIEARAIRGAT